jgi:hypothetical protein
LFAKNKVCLINTLTGFSSRASRMGYAPRTNFISRLALTPGLRVVGGEKYFIFHAGFTPPPHAPGTAIAETQMQVLCSRNNQLRCG